MAVNIRAPRVLSPAGHRPRMLHAALRMWAPCGPCFPTQCDPPTSWPSSTPKSDPSVPPKLFSCSVLDMALAPGRRTANIRIRCPATPPHSVPVPPLLAPPTLNTHQRVATPAPSGPAAGGYQGPARVNAGSLRATTQSPDHRLCPFTCSASQVNVSGLVGKQ